MNLNKGSILVYRVFDIAEEAHLAKLEGILRQTSGEARLKLTSNIKEAVIIRNAPIKVSLGELEVLASHEFFKKAELTATIWDYGALSLAFQFSVSTPVSFQQLNLYSHMMNNDSTWISLIDSLARAKLDQLYQILKPGLVRPNIWNRSEDYEIYFFEEIEGIKKGSELLERCRIPELLLGEMKEVLSAETRDSILANTFQYGESDLVVIDWNSAVVLEPSGQRDITDVLEFALSHLLEVRFYDELLDLRLNELYDSLDEGRSRLFQNVFKLISKEASSRYIEFSEFLERMGNSLKVVGDFYLARIFRGAIRRYRISDWEENITRKMNLLARVSELLQVETNVRRSQYLEIIIVLLILVELLSAVAGHLHFF